jgi:hypothetical protein
VKERTKTEQRKLAELADSLLLRHLQESWPEPQDSVPGWFSNGVPPRYDDSLRTVAVVGAGASIPMETIAEVLATELEKELDSDSRDREVELDRLENVYGLERDNFETRLTAICRTPEAERKVRERISERYRHRHPSMLNYELLAHLLHHRFLDAIISFNFDELLDQAIEDELGPNEYKRVVTERDCDFDLPASVPLYIKMHGTASEPDSLRFTRERYYWIPKSIIELVEQQFDVERLVLVNVGFTMASFDFQYLLRKPRQLQIYNFDPNPLADGVTEEIEQQRAKEREHQKVPRPTAYDEADIRDLSRKGGTDDEDFLPDLLSDAVGVLEELCTDSDEAGPTRWRSIQRHVAVVEVLKGSQTGNSNQYAVYLQRRTILEIAFAAARGRGVLSIGSMVNDRCGRYYERYKRTAGKRADSWQKLCMAGGLKESERWPDTYEVLPPLRKKPLMLPEEEENIHLLKPASAKRLAAHVLKSMNVPQERRKELRTLLTKTIEFLQNETEIEVHSLDDRVCSKTFAEPVILQTFTALRGWTRQLLQTVQDYNELWAVSETGDWIGNDEMWQELKKHCRPPSGKGKQSKPIRLLAAFDANLGKAKRRTELLQLPWGRHNRHMTILCKDGQPRAAIYFVRRLRAPTVTPVYLTNQRDLRRVVEAFEKLWEEAEEYAATQPGANGKPATAHLRRNGGKTRRRMAGSRGR